MADDDNPRPAKRQRTEELPSSSPLTNPPSSTFATPHRAKPETDSVSVPPAVLLASLPGLLAHPPNHRNYIPSLQMSLNAFRKCLAMPALSPELECRAWTGLAEVGMRVVAGGLSMSEDHLWARGIESEVDKALSKGAIIAQKHPSLRQYKHHIALLQAQFSHWQHKTKYARTRLRNLIASFNASDPPYIIYSAYLAAISLLTSPIAKSSSSSSPSSASTFSSTSSSTPKWSENKRPTSTLSPKPTPSFQDIHSALSYVQAMESHSVKEDHAHVTLLAKVLRLRILVAANMWDGEGDGSEGVKGAIEKVEAALGVSYEPSSTPKQRKHDPTQASPPSHPHSQPQQEQAPEQTFISFDDPFEACMVIHTLIMSIAYYTHVGNAMEVTPRLAHLHALLDEGVLEKFGDGLVMIPLPRTQPLIIQSTHPRILFLLTFLISSVAKRDVVGRKPKRKVFAGEGVRWVEREGVGELILPLWSNLGDLEEIEQRLARIKADLLSELVSISIMRSEFDEAEKTLSVLIAHTRTYHIFPLFAPLITLLHAYLAHALGNRERAEVCYVVAARLCGGDSKGGDSDARGDSRGGNGGADDFVYVASRVGLVALDLGRARESLGGSGSGNGGGSTGGEMEMEMEMENAMTPRKPHPYTNPKTNAKGKQKQTAHDEDEDEDEKKWKWEVSVKEVIRSCRGRGMGGTLNAIGHILEACFSGEMLRAKQHLKQALTLATSSQDNHLRALILALIASQYFYTAGDHAAGMLRTCEQLAAGLGAPVNKEKEKERMKMQGVMASPATGGSDKRGEGIPGNAVLGLWVGEHYADLYRRAGEDAKAQRREMANTVLAHAVEQLKRRGASLGSVPSISSLS